MFHFSSLNGLTALFSFSTIQSTKGCSKKPWYLLTNEKVETAEDAWKVVLAYARRWRIGMAFRNLKSDFAIQSLWVPEGYLSCALSAPA